MVRCEVMILLTDLLWIAALQKVLNAGGDESGQSPCIGRAGEALADRKVSPITTRRGHFTRVRVLVLHRMASLQPVISSVSLLVATSVAAKDWPRSRS